MGVFEDVILNAKVAVEAVGKKAGDMVDVSKLKVSAAEINREITHQLEEIGRTIYNAKKAETDPAEDVEKLTKSIDELYEQLAAVNEKIDELKKVAKCPGCGEKVAKNAAYCPKCGKKIDE